MAIKYIDQGDFSGKKVIVRFDFNVPLAKDGSGKITDTTRIDSALPTIKHLVEKGASKIIMMSHLGRPDGQINMKYTLEPVAKYLAEKLENEVVLTETCLDSGIKQLLTDGKTKFILLQNLRFHAEEEDNNRDFAKTLASYADCYVNDAFGTAHRAHASTYEINAFFKNKSYGGFLIKKEVEALSKIVENPTRPFCAVLGGAKVEDKIKTIERLLVSVDKIFIGGAMAYPFLKAKGNEIGKSLCSDDDVKLAKSLLQQDRGNKIQLPVDHVVADSPEGKPETCANASIPADKSGFDVGPKTLEAYSKALAGSKTVFWNGPLGMFENKNFAEGTMTMAKILSNLGAFTLVGGGDSVSAVNKSGLAPKFSHISTGGGASIEFIETAGDLPGIKALKYGID